MRHLPGTEVERKDGRVWIKLPDGKWLSKGRFLFLKKYGIQKGQRVFFKDGDCHNFEFKNLVAINFEGPRYMIEHSRIFFKPKG